MSVPDWWEALLLAIAAWRVFHLLAYDDILDRPRNFLVGLKPGAKTRAGGRQKLMDFLECPFCLGFWMALGWWGSWQIWEHGTLVAATPFVLSAVVIGAQRYLTSDS